MSDWLERVTAEGEIELVQETGDMEIVYALEPKRVDISTKVDYEEEQ